MVNTDVYRLQWKDDRTMKEKIKYVNLADTPNV